MTLAAGARLGSYEVVAAIGVGGMGEVYRARDAKLGRDVALKVIPELFVADADRLARFQREAQVLASLNHPNIAAIYGLEDSDGVRALVLELVEGPTLAERIAQGAVPFEEALPIARQIAEALEAAHEAGVIHRDLKPANIKLRPDGLVKVLDFGLAKLVEAPAASSAAGLSQSPTITSPAMTRIGVILGTAAYMSPEQARGKGVDRRADIWAFGAVLYEMLTGTQAFQGEDVGDILAAVVKTDVDWDLLPDSTPASIRTLLRRCLRKDNRQRLGDAGAARIEIQEALAAPGGERSRDVPLRQTVVPLRVAVLVGLAAVALASTIAAWLRNPSRPQEGSAVARLTIPLSRGTELSTGPSIAVSPDGALVAYVARRANSRQLYIRPMNGFEARAIARTEGATDPFFSPDGQWLGFFADGKLKKVSTTGGVVAILGDAGNGGGGTWGRDDRIVFLGRQDAGLLEVSAAGGAPRPLMTREQIGASTLRYPEFLPGGEALLVTATPQGAATADESAIEVLAIKAGQRKVLVQGGYAARYLPTGHLVFQRSGTLMAVRLDLEQLELGGAPVPVIEGVRQPNYNGVGAFSCSRGGSCVYVAGGTLVQRTATLVDRTGTSRPLPLPPKSYAHPRFSPKGDKVSFWIQQLRCDIDVYDIARGATTRLTSEGDNHFPVWTPDGQQITYISHKPTMSGGRYEVFSKSANGSGSEEQLSKAPQRLGASTPLSWSPHGDALAFADRGDIWLLPLSGKREPRPFVQSRFNKTSPAFSPDGQWLAYVSDESGRFEVYVQPVPGPGEKYPISTDGGAEPVWARSGRELFFRNGDQMMVVQVTTQPSFRASRPRLLFVGTFAGGDGTLNYDVSPDGEHFVMLNSGEQERAATEISVLLNWTEELKRLVPTR